MGLMVQELKGLRITLAVLWTGVNNRKAAERHKDVGGLSLLMRLFAGCVVADAPYDEGCCREEGDGDYEQG